jgi:antitoxin CptB
MRAREITMDSTAPDHNRLLWRSRRGLLELDLLLPPFIRDAGPALSAAQRVHYARLLDCEDQDIWDWFQGRAAAPDPELAAMVAMIRRFNEDAPARGARRRY